MRRLLSRARRSRWALRVPYAIDRFSKALKVLRVRLWRKPLIRLLYSRTDYAPAPCGITLRLTSSCNLRCVQCGQWGERGAFVRPGRPPFAAEMSTDQWKSFIGKVASWCPHIYFFGGEPFLRNDCLELVKFATANDIIAGVNTNGNFLQGKGQAIVDSGMDYLVVSLDGPKEVNNRIRLGNLDVFEAVVSGVRELVRAKEECASAYPLVELCMTLTDSNQAHIVSAAELALQLRVDYFAVTFGIFTTPELAEESSRQFSEEFGTEPHFFRGFVRDMSRMDPHLIATQIQEVKRMWGTRYKQYPPIKFNVADYFRKPEMALTSSPCIAPWVTMQIMPDGEMAFCEDFPDLKVGNVRDSDPLALWNGPGSRAWRRRIRTKGIFAAETRCGDYYLQ
jgi:MoaA/NifB/PqqE/SkfB family radical SAM enzyme